MSVSANRPYRLETRLTETEYQLLTQQMALLGTTNTSAFLRKMAIDGMVIKVDLPQIQELLHQIRRANANINQITKRLHESGRIYQTDLEDIKAYQKETQQGINEILTSLSKLK